MDIQSIQINNSSDSKNIFVKLTPPENAHVPESNELINIPPNSTKTVGVQGGVMNLFVWDKLMNVNWKGIIPTKINKMIVISPEENKVSYDGTEIPSNFETTTHFEDTNPKNNNWPYFIVSLVITLILIGIFCMLWIRGYFR